MPSSTQKANPYGEFANKLSQLTGLDVSVIDAWARAENGANNNILGVTNGGVLAKYSSQTVAAEATATRLQLPIYAGVLASAKGTPSEQALAIAKSPWRLGGAGVAAQPGGIDPYYAKIFEQAGLLTSSGGTTSKLGSVTTPVTDAVGSVVNGLLDAASAPLIFIGVILVAVAFIGLGGLVMLKGNS